MRLFLGVAPDEQTRNAIAALRAGIEARLGAGARAFRWTLAGNLHVTLHFLGDVPPDRLDEVRRHLGAPVEQPAFAASTGRLGTFPGRGAPRVVWLAVDRGAAGMSRLQAVLADRLRQLDLPVESRPFTPHFTLARARDRHAPRHVHRVLAEIDPPAAAWRVASATLFRSDLSGAAPKYEPLVEAPLTGPRRTPSDLAGPRKMP
jgi:2'-5' RNA ligase